MNWEGTVVFFGAGDLERTDRFYRQTLGLELFKDQGLCRIYRVPGGGMVGFCSHQEVVAGDKSPIITLLTADVDGCHDKLRLEGLEPEGKPRANPRFNIYHFFLRDPDGYCVEIQRFLD